MNSKAKSIIDEISRIIPLLKDFTPTDSYWKEDAELSANLIEDQRKENESIRISENTLAKVFSL